MLCSKFSEKFKENMRFSWYNWKCWDFILRKNVYFLPYPGYAIFTTFRSASPANDSHNAPVDVTHNAPIVVTYENNGELPKDEGKSILSVYVTK